MIVATLTIIGILFGGGISELFFIDQLEKGVKEYVIDKEKKKDILSDIKSSKAFIKNYNKTRAANKKSFDALNLSYSASDKELSGFFKGIIAERRENQESFIEDRVAITKKIEQAEWDSIIAFSGLATSKRLQDAADKEIKAIEKNKVKDVFPKTKAAIIENVHSENQKILLNALDDLLFAIDEQRVHIVNINVNSNDILINKDASKEELLEMFSEINKASEIAFNKIVDFHLLVKSKVVEEEFKNIMKALNKELEIAKK